MACNYATQQESAAPTLKLSTSAADNTRRLVIGLALGEHCRSGEPRNKMVNSARNVHVNRSFISYRRRPAGLQQRSTHEHTHTEPHNAQQLIAELMYSG